MGFARLCFCCFFRAATLFEKRQTAEHQVHCGHQPTSVSQNHQCLIYFGLFSKYIISIVQVSGDGARVRTVEDDQHFACFGNNLDQIWTTKDVPDIEKEKS